MRDDDLELPEREVPENGPVGERAAAPREERLPTTRGNRQVSVVERTLGTGISTRRSAATHVMPE